MRYCKPIKGAKFRGPPPPCIIFKGKGTGITAAERVKYHKDVSVHFNKSAWVDDKFARKWVTIFRRYPGIEQAKNMKKPVVLFLDNLGSQTRRGFKRQLRK